MQKKKRGPKKKAATEKRKPLTIMAKSKNHKILKSKLQQIANEADTAGIQDTKEDSI